MQPGQGHHIQSSRTPSRHKSAQRRRTRPLPHSRRRCLRSPVVDDEALLPPITRSHPTTVQLLIISRSSCRGKRIRLLQMRWRVFGTTMQQDEKVCKKIILCACVMHNLTLQHYPCAGTDVDHEDQHHNVVSGTWRQESLNLMEGLMARRGPN